MQFDSSYRGRMVFISFMRGRKCTACKVTFLTVKFITAVQSNVSHSGRQKFICFMGRTWGNPLYINQLFDSWHTLGGSAQSRSRKIHIGVKIWSKRFTQLKFNFYIPFLSNSKPNLTPSNPKHIMRLTFSQQFLSKRV